MNHASHQSDTTSPSRRLAQGPRTWRSWAALALVGLVAGFAVVAVLVQLPGSGVSAATLEEEAPPVALPISGAPEPLPEILGALPFP